jgi:hypothetical protein
MGSSDLARGLQIMQLQQMDGQSGERPAQHVSDLQPCGY